MVSKKLTVILGAGASYSQNLERKPADREEYRPPLTKDLFIHTAAFAPILHKYPLAEILASDIKRQIRRANTLGLEHVLKGYEQRLQAGEDSPISRQFLQVPFYLNDLLGEVATHFTHQPDEYNNLVNYALDNADEVLFLTLNYDTLLEVPLSQITGQDFSDISHYLGNPGWSLVKLHGSTNWYRRFNSYQIGENRLSDTLENLRKQSLPLSLDHDFVMLSVPGHQRYYMDGAPLYPAITVPIDGKYEYNCPPEMIDETKRFLQESKNYLILGTSGHDMDLMDLLKENVRDAHALLIGVSEESVNQIRGNFALAVPRLNGYISTFHDAQGFSGFMNSDAMEKFFNSLD